MHRPLPSLAPAGPGAPQAEGGIPGLAPRGGFRLREGQEAFLAAWADALARGERNALGVFVPGYGKTITALAAFLVARALGVADRVVVFVPRGNLRDQYADPGALSEVFWNLGALPGTFCVADSDRVFLKNLDTELVVTTYQYASGERGNDALLAYCRKNTALFVFDEVHHLADDGTWAQALARFPHAASIALSGTPVRSDNKGLFGVPVTEDADGTQYYAALHEVTMRDAHAEGGILKRVDAHVVDYAIQMVHGDTGEEVELSLSALREVAATSNDVDVYLARRKLRFHEVYLETLLGPAFQRFEEKRRQLAEALRQQAALGRAVRQHQMLVIAMSNRHAAAILEFVERRFPGVSATRIGQDVPAGERAERLAAYREGRVDVMVQVDMIGEGTDIKPISVIVKADLVRALSKTMQQVFRGMRYVPEWPEAENRCDLYAADDSDVVETLRWIAEEQRAGVKKRRQLLEAREAEAPPPAPERSAWELKAVRQQDARTHSLEAMPGYVRSSRDFHRFAPEAEATPEAVDVNARERELRQACARLVSELAFFLAGRGLAVEEREIHARAKQRLQKRQGELSIHELERKRRWLEQCLQAGRLL